MKLKNPLLLIVLISLSLSACMSMPLSTMYKMTQLSILEIDPSEVRVAIRTNELVEIETGAAYIKLSTTTDGLVENNSSEEKVENLQPFDQSNTFKVQLVMQNRDDLAPILLDDIEANEKVSIMRLSDEDATIMKESLARVKDYKAKGASVTGSFSIGTSTSCFKNIEKFDELEVDIFLQTETAEGFIMFLEDIDVIEQAHDHDITLTDASNKCLVED